MKKEIGYIGLGKMGYNMVTRLQEKGWQIHAYDADAALRATRSKELTVVEHIAQFADLPTPRTVWLMVPHAVVDDVLKELLPVLAQGDTIIDGGNSPYKKTMIRSKMLAGFGIHYLDAGVSGGPAGARDGACVMVGGEAEVFKLHKELFVDVAAPDALLYTGASGAGHFVKMVHNGIEYGMMQALGEGFSMLKASSFDLDLEKVANLYNHGSVIESRLVKWLANAFKQHSSELDGISGSVSHSGEGMWTVEDAKEKNIPVPVIEAALDFRVQSDKHPSYTGQVVSALRNQFGGHDVSTKQ
jgi:6-phosphogluconate dehydrogenase